MIDQLVHLLGYEFAQKALVAGDKRPRGVYKRLCTHL